MKIINSLAVSILALSGLLIPLVCSAMPPGTLLYRTARDGKMYGYSLGYLLEENAGFITNIYPGHVGIYIGQENGVDYVVEALANGVVKTPASKFVNVADNETYLGAKLPRDLSPVRQAKVVALAKSLAARGLEYDFDFAKQKGPESGQWTCVGLAEKIYESADIVNPDNLGGLEYNPSQYAVNITPDGFDNESVFNEDGDCFSRIFEFSKIARRQDIIVPAPEIVGFDAGLEHGSDRYFFLPYTQFIQSTLMDVTTDIAVSSNFSSSSVRGEASSLGLVLRWSLINNPLSSLNQATGTIASWADKLASGTKKLTAAIKEKLTGADTKISLAESETPLSSASKNSAKKKASAESSSADTDQLPAVKMTINSNPVKTTPEKTSSTSLKNTSSTVKKSETVSSTTSSTTTIKTASSKKSVSAEKSSSPKKKLSPILINRIYSTGQDDFVELYNPTDTDFDLGTNGYRLEKAKSAKDPGLIARIGEQADGSYPGGTVIPAHGYYLLVSSKASNYYRQQADALITRQDFSWIGSGYTIYLGSAAISSFDDADIVDAVGFGSDAHYFRGVAPAPAITDNYILRRIGSQNDNSLDFSLTPSDDPALASFFQPVSSGSGSSSGSVSEEPDEEEEEEETDEPEEEAIATSTPPAASSTEKISYPLRINGIYGTADNDWLSLHNPSDQDINLAEAGLRLERAKTTSDPEILMRFGNTDDGSYPGGTIIPGNSDYLIVRNDASPFFLDQADAIASQTEFIWTGSGYSLYLAQGAVSSSTDTDIIDLVGFGSDASYFSGSGPAPAIPDYYFLHRQSDTGDNSVDFNLVLSDDPDNPGDEEEPETGTGNTSFFTSQPDLYVFPEPLEAEGLEKSWHFDECYGTGKFTAGKWGCAREVGGAQEDFSDTLSSTLSAETFTMSFYYQAISSAPRLSVLATGENQLIQLTLDEGLITVKGLPTPSIFFPRDFPILDKEWHQAVIVVNQSEDYWAVYIDGQEKIMQDFFAVINSVSAIRATGDLESVRIDDLAILSRALSPEEVASNFSSSRPYAALDREPQQAANLRSYWRFSEGQGAQASDELTGAVLDVQNGTWLGRSHDNYAVAVKYGYDLTANLSETITAQDLSLAFWWRNSDYPEDGRAKVLLTSQTGAEHYLGLFSSFYLRAFWLNDEYDVFACGDPDIWPDDDSWHHLALTYDSYRSILKFYVDGEEIREKRIKRFPDGREIERLVISTNGNSSAIDDLTIWEGALSAAEVYSIFANTK